MKSKLILTLLVIVSLILLVSQRSFGDDKKRTTVLGFNFDTGAETFAESFTSEIRGAVEARLYLGHTGKTQDLEQLALAFGCPETPDPACLKDIGIGLKSTHLIYGTVKKQSKEPPYSFKVETHLFLVASGKIEKTTSLLIPADKQGTVYLQEGADRIIAELFNEPPSTTIIVQSNVGGAIIMLDNTRVGETGADPLWLRDIEPGKHRIIVKKEGYKLFEKKIDIKKGTRVDIDAPLLREGEEGPGDLSPLGEGEVKKKGPVNWKLWTGVALTAAGVGMAAGGMVFSLQTKSKNDELSEAREHTSSTVDVCKCFKQSDTSDCYFASLDEEYQNKVLDICDEKTKLHAGQIALYSAGAVVGGVGLYFLIDGLLHRPEKESDEETTEFSKINLIPTIMTHGGALSISGSF